MRTILAALAISVLAACGGDSATTPTVASVQGTWNLQSVNGAPLPYLVQASGANRIELTADQLTVGANAFTELATYRVTTNGQVSTQSGSDAGTYSLNGTSVTFRYNSNGAIGAGTLSGNTLTVAVPGASYVFAKQ